MTAATANFHLFRTPGEKPDFSKKKQFYFALLGVLGILLLGALAPLRSSKDALASPEAITVGDELALTEPSAELAPLPPSGPPPAQRVARPSGPVAVVTVPSAGLRANHALTAKVIPRSSLRNGEKVALVNRHAPGDGQSWVKVRTQTGKTGWILASLVHIKRM